MTLSIAAPTAWAGDYIVGPDDVLQVEVYGNPDLSQNAVVGTDGTISMPFLGSVEVDNRSASDVAENIRAGLEADFLVNPHVTVVVKLHRSQPVQVTGAVKQPGVRYLTGPTTLRELIVSSGWVDAAKTSGEIIVQRGSETFKVMVAELESGMRDLPVLAHDNIYAPDGEFVYVDGEVAEPGAIRFMDGLTVSQALTHAGGASPVAKLRKVFILRDGKTIQVNLKRVLTGREADVEMKPGDQLIIKESPL